MASEIPFLPPIPKHADDIFATTLMRTEDNRFPDDVHCVAHSSACQAIFETLDIPWGVQWEVARMTTAYPEFTWDKVKEDVLRALRGSNESSAPFVADRLFSNTPEFAHYHKQERFLQQSKLTSPWAEYDLEEEVARRNSSGTSFGGFGGNVSQHIHLEISTTPLSETDTPFEGRFFKFKMQKPAKSKSNRFSRFLGSRRLIECGLPEKDARDQKDRIIKFFSTQKLLINGRLFCAFYGHKFRVYLMEINEDFGRDPKPLIGDDKRMTRMGFISWHNNVSLNSSQKLTKWATRFALGFSTSQPGVVFEPENIKVIEDIYATGKTEKDSLSHEIMTDGCGFLNLAALKMIQQEMSWSSFPVCVQARIAGAKGLFLLHPEHTSLDEPPQVWMRSSQVKIKLHREKTKWSPAHYVMDVLSGPFVQYPSSISSDPILSLSANGVSDEILSSLLRKSIREDADIIELTDKPHSSEILWDSIYSAFHVSHNRLQQIISPELQRSQGFFEYDEDNVIDLDANISSKWDVGPDPASGAPASTEEQVLGYLEAGFGLQDPFVIDKVYQLQKRLLESGLDKYRIRVSQSIRAYVVPDPIGILEPNEVYFGSSQPLPDAPGELDKQAIVGPVLVYRNPCVQISDVRKVMAVRCDALWSQGYRDVIVFSTKGNYSLASMLSGGDYDGDSVVMIWDQDITTPFVNPSQNHSQPPENFIQENFLASGCSLSHVVAQCQMNRGDLLPHLIEPLLKQIGPNRIGLYNVFYRNSAYQNGLDHPDTVRLGHMYTQCLDAAKSGLVVKEDVFSKDQRAWNKQAPRCLSRKFDQEETYGTKLPLLRDRNLPRFILDVLQDVGEEEIQAQTDRLGILRDVVLQAEPDRDLCQPFDMAMRRVSEHSQGKAELERIKAHVERHRTEFLKIRSQPAGGNPGSKGKKRAQGGNSAGERQREYRERSKAYAAELPGQLTMFDDLYVPTIAASYAYLLDATSARRGDYQFSFSVAWAELCALKRRATNPEITKSMAVQKKFVKVFRDANSD